MTSWKLVFAQDLADIIIPPPMLPSPPGHSQHWRHSNASWTCSGGAPWLLSTSGLPWAEGSSQMCFSCLAISLRPFFSRQASPKRRRSMQPQRVVVSAPSAVLLVPPAQQDEQTLHLVLYKRTDSAAVTQEDFPEHAPGFTLTWCDSDRGHKAHWAQYLEAENLTVESLKSQFLLTHHQGPAPHYPRTLLCATSLDNAISCFENFAQRMQDQGIFKYQHFVFHNLTGDPLETLAQDSILKDVTMETTPRPQLTCQNLGLKLPTLYLHSVGDGKYQLVLKGPVWLWRNSLEAWHGSFVNKAILQPCQRDDPGASFVRFTPSFDAASLPSWIQTLHQTPLEIEVDKVPPEILASIAQTPTLTLRGMAPL